jgi:hypothetical protein
MRFKLLLVTSHWPTMRLRPLSMLLIGAAAVTAQRGPGLVLRAASVLVLLLASTTLAALG